MPRKKYIGKTLKAPFNGPQKRMVKNPEKMPFKQLTERQLITVLELIERCNDSEQLQTIEDAATDAGWEAYRNSKRPEEVAEEIWTGSVQLESVKCGKAGCKCTVGNLHGPYWYHYKS